MDEKGIGEGRMKRVEQNEREGEEHRSKSKTKGKGKQVEKKDRKEEINWKRRK